MVNGLVSCVYISYNYNVSAKTSTYVYLVSTRQFYKNIFINTIEKQINIWLQLNVYYIHCTCTAFHNYYTWPVLRSWYFLSYEQPVVIRLKYQLNFISTLDVLFKTISRISLTQQMTRPRMASQILPINCVIFHS